MLFEEDVANNSCFVLRVRRVHTCVTRGVPAYLSIIIILNIVLYKYTVVLHTVQ